MATPSLHFDKSWPDTELTKLVEENFEGPQSGALGLQTGWRLQRTRTSRTLFKNGIGVLETDFWLVLHFRVDGV